MSNRELFKETFSALRVSEKTISEVIEMTQNNQHKRIIRLPGIAVLAACLALMMGLAVTANAATGGELFDGIAGRVYELMGINDYKYTATGSDGEQLTLFSANVEVFCRDGRTILAVDGEETDITGELAESGSYTCERTSGGTVCRVEVTGTPEDYTLRYCFYDEGSQPDYTVIYSPGDGRTVIEDEEGTVLVGETADGSGPDGSLTTGSTVTVTGPED